MTIRFILFVIAFYPLSIHLGQNEENDLHFTCVNDSTDKTTSLKSDFEIIGKECKVPLSFCDLIMPMPIHDSLVSDIWGAQQVLPRDIKNGIEDPTWAYWGGNPMRGENGKYHLYVARWPEGGGHMAWPLSEVAHAVSNNPIGPFIYKETICKGHNPEVIQLKDGRYALHLTKGEVYLSNSLNGPWKFAGVMSFNQRGLPAADWRIHDNMSAVVRDDGSILMVSKDGHIFISRDILGPYKQVATKVYPRQFWYDGLEDPVIWKSENQFHLLVNRWIERKGIYMRSRDGIHWEYEDGIAFDPECTEYVDGTQNRWWKLERPKVLVENNRATYLYFGAIDTLKNFDMGRDKHNSKFLGLPLVPRRHMFFEDVGVFDTEMESFTVRIKSEEGFNPMMSDFDTFRFGSSETVNNGGGLQVDKFQKDGNNVLLTFKGINHGLTRNDYIAKVIGKDLQDGLIYGYVKLSGQPEDYPIVIPGKVDVKVLDNNNLQLTTTIENFGLTKSPPTKVKFVYFDFVKNYEKAVLKEAWGKREKLEGDYDHQCGYRYIPLIERKPVIITSLEVPALNPYESVNVSYVINSLELPTDKTIDFRSVIVDIDSNPDISGPSPYRNKK